MYTWGQQYSAPANASNTVLFRQDRSLGAFHLDARAWLGQVRGLEASRCNRTQPQHNRDQLMSYASTAQHGEIPHGAGLQPNDINALRGVVNYVS